MPYLDINIANAGTAFNGGDSRSAGHMWVVLGAGDGSPPQSFGFAPCQAYYGWPVAPGEVCTTEESRCPQVCCSQTIQIASEQYEVVKAFAENPAAYGFDTETHRASQDLARVRS